MCNKIIRARRAPASNRGHRARPTCLNIWRRHISDNIFRSTDDIRWWRHSSTLEITYKKVLSIYSGDRTHIWSGKKTTSPNTTIGYNRDKLLNVTDPLSMGTYYHTSSTAKDKNYTRRPSCKTLKKFCETENNHKKKPFKVFSAEVLLRYRFVRLGRFWFIVKP